MDCGKLDLNNVALKAPKKAKRNSRNNGFFSSIIWGTNLKKDSLKNSKDLREEYSRIMEEYNQTTVNVSSGSN